MAALTPCSTAAYPPLPPHSDNLRGYSHSPMTAHSSHFSLLSTQPLLPPGWKAATWIHLQDEHMRVLCRSTLRYAGLGRALAAYEPMVLRYCGCNWDTLCTASGAILC